MFSACGWGRNKSHQALYKIDTFLPNVLCHLQRFFLRCTRKHQKIDRKVFWWMETSPFNLSSSFKVLQSNEGVVTLNVGLSFAWLVLRWQERFDFKKKLLVFHLFQHLTKINALLIFHFNRSNLFTCLFLFHHDVYEEIIKRRGNSARRSIPTGALEACRSTIYAKTSYSEIKRIEHF